MARSKKKRETRNEKPYGICVVCLCTDEDNEVCGGNCEWTDKTHSLCTACQELGADERREKRSDAQRLMAEDVDRVIVELKRVEEGTAVGEGFDPETFVADLIEPLELVRWRIAVAAQYPYVET